MSEYQYVAFRAIDGPASDDDLEFNAEAVLASRNHSLDVREHSEFPGSFECGFDGRERQQ